MYRYEEYDLFQLQEDPSLDPADPEVLYAMAKCFQQGKGGVASNEKAAQELFRKADQAGSEQARMEIKEICAPAAPPLDYSGMSSSELAERAEAGDLQAILLRYRSCQELRDRAKAKYYIDRCAKEAMRGRQNIGLRQEALEEAGAFYRDLDQPESQAESRRFYELARELGSITACGVLLDYYDQSIGGEAEPELAEACANQLKDQDAPEPLYWYAVWCIRKNKGQLNIDTRDVCDILRTVAERTEDPLLKARAQAQLHLIEPAETPNLDFLPVLWSVVRKHKEVREELSMLYARLYLRGHYLPVEPKLARYMARVCPGYGKFWQDRADHPGGEGAR